MVKAIRERLAAVERRIADAAGKADRNPAEVRLLVITKGHPVATVQALVESGQRRLGENRVEEALPKIEALGPLPGIEWHLVGPLQSRKVRLVQDHFAMIHSVDRMKAARRLDSEAAVLGRRQAILLECNVSGESTKSGWRVEDDSAWEAVRPEIREVLSLPHLTVLGLMTVGPITDDFETQRRIFRRLAELRRRLSESFDRELPELSMGMSDDFEAAIQQGATIVRIGRAILGERM